MPVRPSHYQDLESFSSPLRVAYRRADRLPELLADETLLAVFYFDASPSCSAQDPRCISVGLPELGEGGCLECWFSPVRVDAGFEEDIGFSFNHQLLFGCLRQANDDEGNLEQTTFRTYRRLLQFARDRGFPHLLRVWNYFPGIHEMRHGQERYHAFSAGRYRALLEAPGLEQRLPAATAIGCQSPDTLIYFLSATEPGVQVENPRQVSAFRYPPEYGVKSPAFSRAMYKDWGTRQHLYISGTASVVGHESRHEHDVLRQLDEILSNFESLILNARRLRLAIGSVSDLSAVKVYLRNPADYEPVRRVLAQAIGDSVARVFLQGAICRPELKLEIDGVYCE